MATQNYATRQAGVTSFIDKYNIGNFVRERRAKGDNYAEIAKKINDTNYLPNGTKISHSTVGRWCRDNGISGASGVIEEERAINIYASKVKAMAVVTEALDTIMTQLDELDKQVGEGVVDVKELAVVIKMLDQMTARQQSLATDIGVMQERIYTYETVSKAMTIIRDTLKLSLSQKDYLEVMVKFRDNPVLRESLKLIAPSEG